MNGRLRIGIRGRLFLGFGAVAAMTVAASVIGWISYARLGDGLDRVVRTSVPALTLVGQLAENGAAITGMAPALAVAGTGAERERIRNLLSENLKRMEELLQAVDDGGQQSSAIVAALAANLWKLDENVGRRLWYRSKKEELTDRLRWASADFIDEIEPMIDDTRFNIDVTLEQEASPAGRIAVSDSREFLRRASANQEALYRINASGNLLVGLIGRAANLPGRESLRATDLYLREIVGRVSGDLDTIKGVPGSLSLRQTVEDILSFAEGDKNLISLRADELDTLETGEKLLERNRALVAELGRMTAGRVQLANSVAQAAAEQSKVSIRQGKTLMLAAIGSSLVFVLLFVWLYVGRSMVGRITHLNASMQAIADGNLKVDVPVGGGDEIGDMGVALQTFRDKLSETQAELVQAAKLAALGQLTAGISHEINQPLTAIRHYVRNAGVLIDKQRVQDARQNLDKISEQTERAIRIVDSLRSQARRPQGNLRPIDLKSVVDNVLTLYEGRIRDMGMDMVVRLHERHRSVRAGQVRLEQVVMNLVGNALDAMQGVNERQLAIFTTETDGQIELRVRDSGIGIEGKNQDRVFEPFYTTKDVGEGLGLGLSISYNIVKGFGGTMRVDSQPGAGTTFRIILDRATGVSE
jgi:phosphoglycerate-specific signal transduction histidine kinase